MTRKLDDSCCQLFTDRIVSEIDGFLVYYLPYAEARLGSGVGM